MAVVFPILSVETPVLTRPLDLPMIRFLLIVLLGGAHIAATAAEAYYRDPALHDQTIVFCAEGDLWRVSTAGGQAQRLTTHPAQESQAVLSADGSQVAFVASYAGPTEVYLMPVAGGIPKQLSFDAGRVLLAGFAPGGEVVYATDNVIGPSHRLILRMVDPNSGLSRDLPLADANEVAFDTASNRLWFTRFGLHISTDNAQDYRGGAMARLYAFDSASTTEAQAIASDWNANARRPMWWNGRLYVLADAGGRPNLWSMAADGSDRLQLTSHADFDVRSPALQGGRIVYQHGADLRLFDIQSGVDNKIDISLSSDFAQRQRRWIKSPLQFVESVRLAPAGDRVSISARGRVLIAAVGPRRRVELATPADSRARQAILSSDGKQALLILEQDGRSELWSFPSDGSGPGKRLVEDESVHRWRLYPSPDGRQLVYDDKRGGLWSVDLQSGSKRRLEQSEFGGDEIFVNLVWSPDSRYLAVARVDSRAQRNQIVLIDTREQSSTVLSSDRYESMAPSFSADGRWLYFLSNRSFVATPSDPWGDRNTGPMFDKRSKIYALALQQGNRFPFAPKDELSPAAAEATATAESKDAKPAALPAIELDGIASRLYELPLAAGNYTALAAAAERLYVLERSSANAEDGRLLSVSISADALKPETMAEAVMQFALSDDGKRLMLVKTATDPEMGLGEVLLVDAGAKLPEKLADFQVRTGGWAIEVDPFAEWQQMYADAWRMHEQFSFDPAMRGQDWNAVRERFAALLPRLADRADLDDLLAQMSAEHGVLHSQIRGAELRRDAQAPAASALGASYRVDQNGVYLQRIYRSDPEVPSERGPLAQSGIDAVEGDRIVSIDGRPVQRLADLARALLEKAGQQILLSVQRGSAKPHALVVTPIDLDREALLRYSDWVESRRALVELAGQGRIGYLHLRAMGPGDISSFVREFYAQINRDGLILDVRRNRGGNIDSWVIEKLLRRTWAFWQTADNQAAWNMQQSFRGHLVVLADQFTYSDGETLAAGVKALDLGPLIGMRTAGAGVWLSDRNLLLDKGRARIAEYPQYDAQGRWLIEGNGVAPDIEVDNPPYASAMGEDAQLSAAMAELERRLASQPISAPQPQPLPARGTPGHDGSR